MKKICLLKSNNSKDWYLRYKWKSVFEISRKLFSYLHWLILAVISGAVSPQSCDHWRRKHQKKKKSSWLLRQTLSFMLTAILPLFHNSLVLKCSHMPIANTDTIPLPVWKKREREVYTEADGAGVLALCVCRGDKMYPGWQYRKSLSLWGHLYVCMCVCALMRQKFILKTVIWPLWCHRCLFLISMYWEIRPSVSIML